MIYDITLYCQTGLKFFLHAQAFLLEKVIKLQTRPAAAVPVNINHSWLWLPSILVSLHDALTQVIQTGSLTSC